MRLQVDPGRGWVWARRLTQSLALITIVLAPLLGGWQRYERTEMAVFAAGGWDLPAPVRDQLPLGQGPAQAYDALVLHGGGTAVEYLSLPVVDPVAGTVAVVRGGITWKLALALGLPVLLALLFGRIFCGWFCPFGVLSRALRGLMARLPWRPKVWRIPRRRPLRWAVLLACVALGVAGVQAALFFFLPHLVVQQAVYATWLLGGGGAILGVLIGLVIAGVVFGPTTYCATICPTGAGLGLLGRARRVHLTLAEPGDCGAHCRLCNSACWLGLDPASGDPGPDCDSCARCTVVCPRVNMRVAVGPPRRRHLPVVATLLALLLLPATAAAQVEIKPDYLLNGERVIDGVTVALSAVDHTGVKLDLDWEESERGVELSLFIARGTRGPADERGLLPEREVYRGPLVVVVEPRDRESFELSWKVPNSPISTQGTSIYRRRIPGQLAPGDRVAVRPIAGWLDREVSWRLPEPGTAPGPATTAFATAAAALVFMGLLALALAMGDGHARD